MRFVTGSHSGKKYRHEDTFDENNLLHRGPSIEAGFSDDDITHLEMDAGQEFQLQAEKSKRDVYDRA